MKIAIATAATLLAATSFAFAADNKGGGKDGKNGTDPTTTGSLKGNGLNIDGTSDDAEKCRAGTAGAALCGERDMNTDMQ